MTEPYNFHTAGKTKKDRRSFKDVMRQLSRERMLEHQKVHGKPRSKSWDTIPTPKQERQQFKQNPTGE